MHELSELKDCSKKNESNNRSLGENVEANKSISSKNIKPKDA